MKQLDGVSSVEDEWEREIESDEDLDVLFVSFDTSKVTVEQLIALAGEHGFTAEVRETNK